MSRVNFVVFKWVLRLCLGCMLVVTCSNVYPDSSSKQMQKEIEKLKKDLKKLKKKVNKQDTKAKKDYKKLPKVNGLFQQDVDVFDGAYNADGEGEQIHDTFLRRLRVGIGDKHKDWKYYVLLDFSNDEDFQSELIMARLRYSGFKQGPNIDIGKIREDISLEALSSSSSINTVSRSMMANIMSPYFNWGVGINQYIKPVGLRYALGVYKGRGFGSNGNEKDSDKMVTAYTSRLTWAPLNKNGQYLHFGVWNSHREYDDGMRMYLRDRAEVRDTNVRLVDYAAGGSRFEINKLVQTGYEIAAGIGPVYMQAEYAERDVTAVDPINDNVYEGGYVGFGGFLTGEKVGYKPNSAIVTSPKPKSKYGAWEVLVRASEFDATSETQGTKVTANTVGANYHYSKKLKLMLNYIESEVEGPGAEDLIGEYNDGSAYTFRVQYSF